MAVISDRAQAREIAGSAAMLRAVAAGVGAVLGVPVVAVPWDCRGEEMRGGGNA